ncbi:MAG: InlB B-repeat-containing protein [Clostridia bacterium]|nr:InlB B-repeat-containing protein [Clostridia bacterium]
MKKAFRFPILLVFLAVLLLGLPVLSSCKEEPAAKYDVTFESNGGTMYYSVRAEAGDTVTLPTPEKEGYEFVGWYDNAELSGDALEETFTVSANATLYAKWDAYEGTIVFVSDGGTSYNDLTFSAQRVQLPTPKKEGFLFGGWYESETFEGESLASEIVPTGDMTLYAKWDVITGSVFFVSNGGTEYERVDTAGQKVALPTPEKEGEIFAGWYDNAQFSGKVYEGELIPQGNVTLYARWASNCTVITLEENGGQPVSDVKLFDNDRLSLPTPEYWGYTFKGWYETEALTGEPVDEYFYYPTSDVTLYAKWEKCSYLYLFYGDTKMDWERFEYPVDTVITLDELNALMTPESIIITDYRGDEHICPFEYWAYQGVDETSHIKVVSNVTLDEDFLILVADYDESEVPPDEHLSYDRENDVYTTTGKVAHLFIDEVDTSKPYAYSLNMSFRKGDGGAFGPAFRMRVSDADYHYESGCDYLSPVINTASGTMYIARVLNGSWGNFVATFDFSLLPKAWQEKYNATSVGGLIELTMSVVDYGTWFEVYIDNDLAYTYTNATNLASYPYKGLGARSSTTPSKLWNPVVSYGYEISFATGVDGLTAQSTTWLCGDIQLPTLVRDGYALEGWYYDQALTQRVDDENFAPTKATTLYAKWSTDYVVVSFNTKGGTACDSVNYAAGKLFTPDTERMNYIFTGWYYDEACTQPVDVNNFAPTGNITLYAGWRLPYTKITDNGNGTYTYTSKTEAVLGTLEHGVPAANTYHEFSQTITMTKGVASVGIAFRMNVGMDYTYETAGTSYLSVQFAGGAFRISRVLNGSWARILPNNADYGLTKLPQSWQDKYNGTADGGKITVTLMIRDYGTYFEAYIDGTLAYTYGQNGESVDLTQYTGNGYGIRCSAGSEVIFKDITANVKTAE